MRKQVFIVMFLAAISFTATAQQEGHISLGIDAGIPAGSSADNYTFAIGGSLKVENPISDNAQVTITLGFTSLSTKSTYVPALDAIIKPPAATFAPLKIGLKYRLAGPLSVEGQTGAAFEIRGRRTTRFVYSPGLVFDVDRLDVGVRYEGWAGSGGAITQTALRVGYRF